MTRGVWVIIAVGVILIMALWLGVVCAKVNAEYVPGGAAASPAQSHAGIETCSPSDLLATVASLGRGYQPGAGRFIPAANVAACNCPAPGFDSYCPRQVAGCNRAALYVAGADCIVGGCGVARTTRPRCELTGGPSDSPSAKEVAGDSRQRNLPNSGQPPTLNIAPAGVCVVAGDSALATGYEPKPEGGPGGLIDLGDEGGCGAGNAPAGDGGPAKKPAAYLVGPAGENPASHPSIPSDAKQAGRAADKRSPSAASAIGLPHVAGVFNQAQARLACSFPAVRQALDMLRHHESVNGTRMVGDGRKAQGWLQQHKGHWGDGCEVLGVSWPWPGDTRDLAKCELVAVGCWMRYAPGHMASVEELVRRFRLPFAPHRADNDAYWQKVREVVP